MFRKVVLPTAILLVVETPMSQLVVTVRLIALLQVSWEGRVIERDEDVLLRFLERMFLLALDKFKDRLLFCSKYILDIEEDRELRDIETLLVAFKVYLVPPEAPS